MFRDFRWFGAVKSIVAVRLAVGADGEAGFWRVRIHKFEYMS